MIPKFKESLMTLIGLDVNHSVAEKRPFILLAVSGGIDSMCMAHLFYRVYTRNFAIATVNFSLRGEESDSDEELVRDWALERGIKYHNTTFDTKSYAHSRGISTQMAARDLRYEWFNQLMDSNNYDYIAVAHNLNDSVETFFINILRGTGIDGLTGIKRKNGRIIRPMLGITRREIAEFIKSEGIPFREDSSNCESHYSRNRLRNMVFPEFEIINQSFLKTVERDMANVESAAEILDDLLAAKRGTLLDESSSRISISALLAEKRPDYWLYMILQEYGFNSSQTDQILKSIDGQPGKEFHTESCLLLKDRDYLLLYPKGVAAINPRRSNIAEPATCDDNSAAAVEEPGVIKLNHSGDYKEISFEGIRFRFSIYPKPIGFKFKKEKRENDGFAGELFTPSPLMPACEKVVLIDADLVSSPLYLRRWSDGDRFMPLGMRGFKKISDYLTDIRIDKVSKESQTVVLSDDKIIALPGYRIDERFKITNHTKNILEISII
jgi:tRNA(Ile)-lysidine synthase